MGSVRVFLVAARILIVLIAGVPATPFWVGVTLTSHVPAFVKRIVHFAVRFFVFLFVAILQVPRVGLLARVSNALLALRVPVMAYVVRGAAVNVVTIG